MTFEIPGFSGLAKELSDRCGEDNLYLVEASTKIRSIEGVPCEKITAGIYLKHKNRLDEVLGTLTIERNVPCFGRICYAEYDGRMPWYENDEPGDDHLQLAATSTPIGSSELELGQTTKDTSPNNTPERPLYRRDYHRLRFLDHEVPPEIPEGDSVVFTRRIEFL